MGHIALHHLPFLSGSHPAAGIIQRLQHPIFPQGPLVYKAFQIGQDLFLPARYPQGQ